MDQLTCPHGFSSIEECPHCFRVSNVKPPGMEDRKGFTSMSMGFLDEYDNHVKTIESPIPTSPSRILDPASLRINRLLNTDGLKIHVPSNTPVLKARLASILDHGGMDASHDLKGTSKDRLQVIKTSRFNPIVDNDSE